MIRKLKFAPVLEARRTGRLSESRAGDFKLGPVRPASSTTGMGQIVPYCLDIFGRRSLYVGGIDLQALQSAPFYYLYARNHAKFVVSIPWERQLAGEAACAPLYVFSAGRVGSTLLCSVLENAGIPSLSEPDFYTQLTSPLLRIAPGWLQTSAVGAAAALSQDLMAAFATPGRPLVVKLRAECCGVPQQVLTGSRERRTIFMTRSFESWARSSMRVFRRTPAQLVERYIGAARCYADLRQQGPCHLVQYEELLSNPEVVCAGLGQFLGVPVPPEAASAALAFDSQRATPLEKGKRKARGDLDDRLAAALHLWQGHRHEAEALLSISC